MTQEEIKNIEECNKLIDKFYWEGFTGQRVNHNPSPINMGYHISWDALMPVVEKIESLDYLINISGESVMIYKYSHPTTRYDELIFEYHGENKLQSTYLIIVEFIHWYNKTNKNEQ